MSREKLSAPGKKGWEVLKRGESEEKGGKVGICNFAARDPGAAGQLPTLGKGNLGWVCSRSHLGVGSSELEHSLAPALPPLWKTETIPRFLLVLPQLETTGHSLGLHKYSWDFFFFFCPLEI